MAIIFHSAIDYIHTCALAFNYFCILQLCVEIVQQIQKSNLIHVFFSLLNSYLFFFNFVLFFGPFETMLTLHTVSIDCFFFSRWLMVVCIVIFYLDQYSSVLCVFQQLLCYILYNRANNIFSFGCFLLLVFFLCESVHCTVLQHIIIELLGPLC